MAPKVSSTPPKKGSPALLQCPATSNMTSSTSKAEPLIPAQLKLDKSAPAQIANGFALACICIMAFAVRLFSVIKYESVIHEFDPYFNYRVTQYLTKNGFYEMWNWFDDRTWYPLGRVVGGTVYPVSMPPQIRLESFFQAAQYFIWRFDSLNDCWMHSYDHLDMQALNLLGTWWTYKDFAGSQNTTPGHKQLLLQGLIYTAGLMHNVLHALNIPLHVQEVR